MKITLLGWVGGGDENCLASQLICSVDICPLYTLSPSSTSKTNSQKTKT